MSIPFRFKFSLEIGHRVLGDENCGAVHGHSLEVCACWRRDDGDAPRLSEKLAILTFSERARELFEGGFVAEDTDPIVPFLLGQDARCVVLDEAPTLAALAQVLAGLWREAIAETAQAAAFYDVFVTVSAAGRKAESDPV